MLFLSIDLQPGFSPANDYGIINAARGEALRAKRFNYGIILLEYNRHGSTLSQIKSACWGHTKLAVAKKDSDDGSIEVIDTAFAEGYNIDVIRVCGVCVEYCVLDTVRGLKKYSPKSKIILNAAGCGGLRKPISFKKFKKIKDVYLIGGQSGKGTGN